MHFIYITRKNQSNLGRATSSPLTQTIPMVTMESPTVSPFPKMPLPFDNHHQNLTRQYQAPPQPPSPTASGSTQPFCQDAECGLTERPWCVAVHCRNIAEHFQTTVVFYGACSASSTPCSGVHHILSPLAIIAVHYRNITESLRTTGMLADHCGALRCTTVHWGNFVEALQTTGMLPNHCG